jgi:hypothetical protein
MMLIMVKVAMMLKAVETVNNYVVVEEIVSK